MGFYVKWSSRVQLYHLRCISVSLRMHRSDTSGHFSQITTSASLCYRPLRWSDAVAHTMLP